jgi:hypothetical protein
VAITGNSSEPTTTPSICTKWLLKQNTCIYYILSMCSFLIYHNGGGRKFLQNVSNLLPVYTESHPIWQQSSQSLLQDLSLTL